MCLFSLKDAKKCLRRCFLFFSGCSHAVRGRITTAPPEGGSAHTGGAERKVGYPLLQKPTAAREHRASSFISPSGGGCWNWSRLTFCQHFLPPSEKWSQSITDTQWAALSRSLSKCDAFSVIGLVFFLISSSLIEPPEWQLLLERCRHLLASVAQEVPEENVYKLKMTDLALDATIELGHWEEALQYGQKTLSAYRYRECGVFVCVCFLS